MSDETPAPLSDAELVVVAHLASLAAEARGDAKFDEGAPILLMDAWRNVRRLLSTLAARDAQLAALERDNAVLREIVAAVADGWSNALGTRVGETAADGLALKARARALLVTSTPPGMTAQEGDGNATG